MSALQWATLSLLGLATLAGVWRIGRTSGPRGWIGLLGQPVMAILLWLVIYPPRQGPHRGGRVESGSERRTTCPT